MSLSANKYRPAIIIISLFYLNFFFLSPFLHHHHSAEEFLNENIEVVHSHLFSDEHVSDHSHQTHTHFNDGTEHCHSLQDTDDHLLTQTREIQSALTLSHNSTLDYSQINQEFKPEELSPTNFFPQIQWEKFIQSATNVSPPIC